MPVLAHSGRWVRAPSAWRRSHSASGELGQVALVGDARVGDRDATAQRRVCRAAAASALVSIRETKNDATDAIASSGSPAAARALSPRR